MASPPFPSPDIFRSESPGHSYDPRKNTLFWTPTVAPPLLYEYTRDNPERIDDPRWHRGLPDEVIQDVRASLDHLERLPY